MQIQYRLNIGDLTVTDDLHQLFDDAVSEPISDRDVRFAVYRLGKLEDDYAVRWILDHIAEVPYLSELLVKYLSEHAANHPEIEQRIVAFIKDEKLNISPHVEMQFIRMLANAPSLQQASYDMLWDIARNSASDSLSRQFAVRAIGRHLQGGRSADLELLRSLFHLFSYDLPLRRAILVALKEGGDAEKVFLDSIAAGTPDLRPVCKYLRSNPKLPPP